MKHFNQVFNSDAATVHPVTLLRHYGPLTSFCNEIVRSKRRKRNLETFNLIHFTAIKKQVIQLIQNTLVGIDKCVRMHFLCEEPGVPDTNPLV